MNTGFPLSQSYSMPTTPIKQGLLQGKPDISTNIFSPTWPTSLANTLSPQLHTPIADSSTKHTPPRNPTSNYTFANGEAIDTSSPLIYEDLFNQEMIQFPSLEELCQLGAYKPQYSPLPQIRTRQSSTFDTEPQNEYISSLRELVSPSPNSLTLDGSLSSILNDVSKLHEENEDVGQADTRRRRRGSLSLSNHAKRPNSIPTSTSENPTNNMIIGHEGEERTLEEIENFQIKEAEYHQKNENMKNFSVNNLSDNIDLTNINSISNGNNLVTMNSEPSFTSKGKILEDNSGVLTSEATVLDPKNDVLINQEISSPNLGAISDQNMNTLSGISLPHFPSENIPTGTSVSVGTALHQETLTLPVVPLNVVSTPTSSPTFTSKFETSEYNKSANISTQEGLIVGNKANKKNVSSEEAKTSDSEQFPSFPSPSKDTFDKGNGELAFETSSSFNKTNVNNSSSSKRPLSLSTSSSGSPVFRFSADTYAIDSTNNIGGALTLHLSPIGEGIGTSIPPKRRVTIQDKPTQISYVSPPPPSHTSSNSPTPILLIDTLQQSKVLSPSSTSSSENFDNESPTTSLQLTKNSLFIEQSQNTLIPSPSSKFILEKTSNSSPKNNTNIFKTPQLPFTPLTKETLLTTTSQHELIHNLSTLLSPTSTRNVVPTAVVIQTSPKTYSEALIEEGNPQEKRKSDMMTGGSPVNFEVEKMDLSVNAGSQKEDNIINSMNNNVNNSSKISDAHTPTNKQLHGEEMLKEGEELDAISEVFTAENNKERSNFISSNTVLEDGESLNNKNLIIKGNFNDQIIEIEDKSASSKTILSNKSIISSGNSEFLHVIDNSYKPILHIRPKSTPNKGSSIASDSDFSSNKYSHKVNNMDILNSLIASEKQLNKQNVTSNITSKNYNLPVNNLDMLAKKSSNDSSTLPRVLENDSLLEKNIETNIHTQIPNNLEFNTNNNNNILSNTSNNTLIHTTYNTNSQPINLQDNISNTSNLSLKHTHLPTPNDNLHPFKNTSNSSTPLSNSSNNTHIDNHQTINTTASNAQEFPTIQDENMNILIKKNTFFTQLFDSFNKINLDYDIEKLTDDFIYNLKTHHKHKAVQIIHSSNEQLKEDIDSKKSLLTQLEEEQTKLEEQEKHLDEQITFLKSYTTDKDLLHEREVLREYKKKKDMGHMYEQFVGFKVNYITKFGINLSFNWNDRPWSSSLMEDLQSPLSEPSVGILNTNISSQTISSSGLGSFAEDGPVWPPCTILNIGWRFTNVQSSVGTPSNMLGGGGGGGRYRMLSNTHIRRPTHASLLLSNALNTEPSVGGNMLKKGTPMGVSMLTKNNLINNNKHTYEHTHTNIRHMTSIGQHRNNHLHKHTYETGNYLHTNPHDSHNYNNIQQQQNNENTHTHTHNNTYNTHISINNIQLKSNYPHKAYSDYTDGYWKQLADTLREQLISIIEISLHNQFMTETGEESSIEYIQNPTQTKGLGSSDFEVLERVIFNTFKSLTKASLLLKQFKMFIGHFRCFTTASYDGPLSDNTKMHLQTTIFSKEEDTSCFQLNLEFTLQQALKFGSLLLAQTRLWLTPLNTEQDDHAHIITQQQSLYEVINTRLEEWKQALRDMNCPTDPGAIYSLSSCLIESLQTVKYDAGISLDNYGDFEETLDYQNQFINQITQLTNFLRSSGILS